MIELIPYTHIDGIPTFKNSDILGFYDRMVKEGTASVVLNDGTINTRDDFLQAMRDPGNYLNVAYLDGEVAGICWLNRMKKKTAYFHFCLFSNGWGKNSVAIGKKMADTLINLKNSEGEYLFDMFMGICPSSNRLAIGFMQRCGGKVAGELPFGAWNHRKQKSEPGTLVYYTREACDENL